MRHALTIRVYHVTPAGDRVPESADEYTAAILPDARLADPAVWPECRCPIHRPQPPARREHKRQI